jgi:hypothetical protein
VAEAPVLAFPSVVARDNHLVATLTAYFDESGTHAGSPAVSVAGYLSTPEQWIKFEAEWRHALADLGLDTFHMNQFANRAGPYRAWSEPQCRIRLSHLIEIINRNVVASFGVVIPTEPFDRLFSPKAKKHCGGAYGLAATFNFLEVGRILRAIDDVNPWDARVAYVFESGAVGMGQIQKVFQYNKKDPEQEKVLRLLSLRFGDKRNFGPLQAADILAYELYRQLPRQIGLDPRPPRTAILRELAIPQRNWGRIDEEEMKSWSDIIETSADLATLLGWPRKRGEDFDQPAAIRRAVASRAKRRSHRKSTRDR